MIHTDYIVEVLGRFEGKAVAKGYIPCQKGNYYGTGPIPGDPLGASGVTIGTGFDLGQQNREALDKLNLPGPLAEKLIPYLGVKKEAALKKLGELPFTLTAEEVSVLDEAVHNKYIMETVSLFGQDRFEEAPKQAQAVAVSHITSLEPPGASPAPPLNTHGTLSAAVITKRRRIILFMSPDGGLTTGCTCPAANRKRRYCWRLCNARRIRHGRCNSQRNH